MMNKMNSRKVIIKNTLKDIQYAIEVFEEFAIENEMPLPTTMKVNIVLDELLSNTVKYGYTAADEGFIEIFLELFANGKLTIVLSDKGQPFNPFTMETPSIDEKLEERDIGGLGILLVKELMDEYHYRRIFNLNVVSMTKHQA